MRALLIKITLIIVVMFFSVSMLARYHFTANNLDAKVPLVLRPVDALSAIWDKMLGSAKHKVNDVKNGAITQYTQVVKSTASQTLEPDLSGDKEGNGPAIKRSDEWDSISNADRICWVHRKSRKMECEQKVN